MTEHKKILIVDDDPRVLFILRATLEGMSNCYQIESARDGTEALGKVRQGTFDLIISDVRMPGVNGIQLVEQVRAMKVDAAVIWITAYGCNKLWVDRERLGVHNCLDKPLRIGAIRRAALEALGLDEGTSEA